MKTICDACNATDIYSLYRLDRIPAFQNKLFKTREAAQKSPVAAVDLMCCPHCDLVFNAAFDHDLMDYDDDYQNAQDHSPSFQSYLEEIAGYILEEVDIKQQKIVEIGCGKAYFMQILLGKGADVIGFDPTYEGDDPRVEKCYFTRETAEGLKTDAVVMRHTLEHIDRPLDFLKELQTFLPAHVTIHIEIPRFEWIIDHNAFWDIFHEHCNYFTERFFQRIFGGKAKIRRTFSDQYMLVSAKLADLVTDFSGLAPFEKRPALVTDIPSYRTKLQKFQKNYVWGAGAKGIAFANILDADVEKITAVIDINPRKQQHFLPLSGHPCIAPEKIDWAALGDDACLWIMNDNYKTEILKTVPAYKQGHVIILGTEPEDQ